MNDPLSAIKDRRSCRTFDSEPLSPIDRAAIEDLLAGRTTGPFGSVLRFRLLDAGAAGAPRGTGWRLGTYGVVRGAPGFVAGVVVRGPADLLDFGWILEEIILELTVRGFGTCWLAGTFSRSGFAAAMDLAEGELLPAVTPVGRSAERPSLVDAVMRAGAGSARRRTWRSLFYDGEIGRPLRPSIAGPWEPCLEAVRLAPSASNAQPWRIVRRRWSGDFHLLVAGFSASPWRRLDAGIAMYHFHLVARQHGLPGRWVLALPPEPAGRKGLVEVATWRGA